MGPRVHPTADSEILSSAGLQQLFCRCKDTDFFCEPLNSFCQFKVIAMVATAAASLVQVPLVSQMAVCIDDLLTRLGLASLAALQEQAFHQAFLSRNAGAEPRKHSPSQANSVRNTSICRGPQASSPERRCWRCSAIVLRCVLIAFADNYTHTLQQTYGDRCICWQQWYLHTVKTCP